TLAFIANEQTLVNQFFNIPLRSGDRALRDDSPLASRKVALEAIENSIEHIPLAFIERDPCVALPEMGLTQDRSAGNFSGIKRGKGKGVRNHCLSRVCDFPEFPLPSSDKSQAQQPDSDPDQLAEPPEQREGDAGHIGVAEGTEQQQIPAVLGTEAAGDEEGAAFDKDGEGADGDSGEGHGRPSQIPDDDVHFQRFRYPTKEEQPGGGTKGWTFVAVESPDRSIQRLQSFLTRFEIGILTHDPSQKIQEPGKESLPLHKPQAGSHKGQQAHAQECSRQRLTG